MTRMNVQLAAQVFSSPMVDLFEVTLKKGDPATYNRMAPYMGPMLQLLQDWNHAFDILNSRVAAKSEKVKVHHINKRDHLHVRELLTTSARIVRWKLQSQNRDGGENPPSWLAKPTGDEAIELGLAVAALAALHAETPGGPIICKRLDQDCCEHHFANTRLSSGHGSTDVTAVQRALMASAAFRVQRGAAKGNARASPADPTALRAPIDLRDHMPTKEDIERESARLDW